MKLTVHIFKPSGKWYQTFDLELPAEIKSAFDHYDVVGHALRNYNTNYDYCHPSARTLDSWFAMTTVSDLPLIIWLH